MIHYLKHTEIDKIKWDQCISDSLTPSIYALSWYLDIVSKEWDALVENDYQYIMPITKKKKFGILYLYQPIFCQQLGLYSSSQITQEKVNEFIHILQQKYKLIDICIHNKASENLHQINIKERINYELNLSNSYEFLYSKYSENTKRNIKKINPSIQLVINNIPVEEMVDFFKENIPVKLNKEIHRNLNLIIKECLNRNLGLSYTIKYNNKICACVFFIHYKNRYIYLLTASNKEGKENKSIFFILDSFIKENQKSNIVLDFEGSSIENIARFYAGFGAQSTSYYYIHYDNLSWFIKLIKK